MSQSWFANFVYIDSSTRPWTSIKKRQLTPIGPITTFSFADIPSAFRYMRGGKHIGKIVISDGPNTDVQVAVWLFMNPLRA